ncbi:hypothetical protein D3C87_1842460 [compost metagenome]
MKKVLDGFEIFILDFYNGEIVCFSKLAIEIQDVTNSCHIIGWIVTSNDITFPIAIAPTKVRKIGITENGTMADGIGFADEL